MVVLPTVPFGVQTTQLDIQFCMNVNPSTQAALLGDLARALEGQGVRKLVILNGHGGNDFNPMIRELLPQMPALPLRRSTGGARRREPFFDKPGDHGGELETSVMLHVAPELVRPLPRRARPRAAPDRGRSASAGRGRRGMDHGHSGYRRRRPAAATPEKGAPCSAW